MARPKRRPAQPNEAPDDRLAVIHLKGTREYAEWLDSLYKETHIPKASMFRLAMAEWAEKKGFRKPPEM